MKDYQPDIEHLRSAADSFIKTAQDIGDRSDLEDFRMKRAADYFNEKAKKCPTTAKESLRLSKLFSETARLVAKLDKEDRDASDREMALMEECGVTFNALGEEIKALDAHVSAGIDTFIAENPARWQRIEKSMPGLVVLLKPTQK